MQLDVGEVRGQAKGGEGGRLGWGSEEGGQSKEGEGVGGEHGVCVRVYVRVCVCGGVNRWDLTEVGG